MKQGTRSVSRQLSFVIPLVGGSLLLIGGLTIVVRSLDPWAQVGMLGVLMALATVAARYASRRVVSGPILSLAEAVSEASASEDFSARLTRRPSGAIGILVDSINGLLEQTEGRVEERDQRFKRREKRFEDWERGESARLEIEVVARTRKLRESNEKLKLEVDEAIAVNQAQTRFIANMIHEIRTPMNGVLGITEMLSHTELTPQQLRYTRAVLGSGEDLLAIINNILDFSKIENGKLERVDNQPFSPTGCVERVSDLLVARASLGGLELSHECGDDVPAAMLGDGKRLRQVLTNMIGNSIKFTERGRIVVRTTLVERSDVTSTIRFEVVDTGIGIPSHLHEHIFEGFSQADSSTTRQFQGTGLGLSISKRLVELMGGTIGGILVAEDNLVNREVATAMLQSLKCRGDIVVDGVQAVEAVQRKHYDLVLLDCQMPNLDGYEATRQIRRLEQQGQVKTDGPERRHGHLPIVALSAHTAPEDRARSLDSGVDDFVSKPFTLQTLRGVIAKWARGEDEPSSFPLPLASVQTLSNAVDDAPINEAALEQLLEIDRLSGGGVFVRVARAFLEAAPTILEKLGKAVRESDAEGMARAAHELRSASLNVGAESMATLSKQLETLGRTGATDAAASVAAKLDELYPAVRAALAARLEKDFRDDTVSV